MIQNDYRYIYSQSGANIFGGNGLASQNHNNYNQRNVNNNDMQVTGGNVSQSGGSYGAVQGIDKKSSANQFDWRNLNRFDESTLTPKHNGYVNGRKVNFDMYM